MRDAMLSELEGKKIIGYTNPSTPRYHNYHPLAEFVCETGERYWFYHRQDCRENVWLVDTDNDPQLLVGQVVTDAYVTSSRNYSEAEYMSSTWTFYTIATRNVSVTFRFCGQSNGYYSERVDFCEDGHE